MITSRTFLTFCLLAGLTATALSREPKAVSQLPPNSRVAIIGDSITEQKMYSKYIETYLLACTGRKDITCFQFGWSGETAGGFAQRAENDLSVFKPTVATICYGMNDGGYKAYEDSVGNLYEKNMRAVLEKLDAAGVKNVVVGTPGAVDTKFFTRLAPAVYNNSLSKLGDIGRKLAEEKGYGFANVHDTMFETMIKAKAAIGDSYDVCGRDGFHPGANGQLLMAYAFLKSLGVEGKIGDIEIDAQNLAASKVSEGHRIAATNEKSGAAREVNVIVESSIWPFCFEGDAKASGGTRSITAFCGFNQDLNRLTLRVNNLGAEKAKVTWGAATKEFTKDQLSKGINLTEEFTSSPFDEPFRKLMGAVGAKQAYETPVIKSLVTQFRLFAQDAKEDAEFGSCLETLKRKVGDKQARLDGEARKHLVPVTHEFKIQPL